MAIRAAYGSVRVGFVPNPDLTQQHWVGKILTATNPNGDSNQSDWVLSVSVCKSCRILAEILQDLTSYSQYSSGSIEIWTRSLWIYQDLAEISLYRWSQSSGLSDFCRKLQFQTRREQVIRRVQLVSFSDSQTATQINSFESWCQQPTTDQTTAWIGRLLGEELWVQAVLQVQAGGGHSGRVFYALVQRFYWVIYITLINCMLKIGDEMKSVL